MKVFVYGCRILDMDAIRWHFGKNDYIDVTNQYQDILALNADMVLVNVENCKKKVLDVIKTYEAETKDVEEREYIYLTDDMLTEWYQDMYEKFHDAVKEASKTATMDQKKALSLFYIHSNDEGYISDISSDDARNVFFIEFYRKSSQTTELIILSCGDDSISKTEYDKYTALGKYDRVSVDWHKEANKDLCLEELFYNRTDISELPPILKPLKELLDTHTEPFKYAWFGED